MSAPHASPTIPQEKDTLSGRRAAWITGITVVVVVLACLWAKWLLDRGREELGARVETEASAPRRAPAELSLVDQTLIEHAFPGTKKIAEQRARLRTYGWTDRAAGRVHIPIERAMELVLREEVAR